LPEVVLRTPGGSPKVIVHICTMKTHWDRPINDRVLVRGRLRSPVLADFRAAPGMGK
jgi:hypothetical protein